MKKFRKLIPAFVLLLISTAIMSSATFAWFSMNTQVTATGMQVTAKSNNTYLLIGDTWTTDAATTATNIQAVTPAQLTVPLTVADSDADVFPAAPALTAEQAAYLPASTGKKVDGTAIATAGVQVTNNTTAAAVTNWFTATAEAPTAATMLAGSARQLTTFTDYVIVKHAYLTLAVGSNNAQNLTVTGTILPKGLTKVAAAGKAEADKTYYSYSAGVFTNLNATAGTTDVDTSNYVLNAASGPATIDLTAVKVLIATDDGALTTLSILNNDSPVDIKGSNTALTSSTVRIVDIYIYIDGNATPVYTNNIPNLKDATIDLAFNVEAIPAA